MMWQTALLSSSATLLIVYLLLINSIFDATSPLSLLKHEEVAGGTIAAQKNTKFPLDIGYWGPIQSGKPSSLRNFNPKAGATSPYVTSYTVEGQAEGDNIEHLWGALSPYFVSDGFGVEEEALPATCKVKQVQILSRHGARYPTAFSSLLRFADKMQKLDYKASGVLSFLNNWSYELGAAILVPVGKQQLYDSGVLASMQYGGLYDHENTKDKLVFRTTTQKRMTESALSFLEGFFGGEEWKEHANLELIIEAGNFNNTLSPYMTCTNANEQMRGSKNRKHWESIYLRNKTEQFSQLMTGMDWTIEDTAAAQLLCPYETVANGYSQFCELFSFQEWKDFDYAESLWFEQNCAFGAPTGRAQGIGWVNEMIRRIEKKPFDYSTISSENSTFDADKEYFPLNQNIYVDFTHDSVIASVVAALDFKQFSKSMPRDGPEAGETYYSTSKLTPFAARLAVEIIECEDEQDDFIHFTLNQRTVPLDTRKYGSGYRKNDGWAKLGSWLSGISDRNEMAAWNYACYGEYEFDGIDFTDGRPI